MLNTTKKVIKSLFPGISWQNPVINGIFKLIDPLDLMIRRINDLPDMPSYSIRVRSNGVTGQFGGNQFARNGKLIVQLLPPVSG